MCIRDRDKINNILGRVPLKIPQYYKAQKEGASITMMMGSDRNVTRMHLGTKKKDGKLRVHEFLGDEVWSIFPQHVKGRLIEEALSECVFLQKKRSSTMGRQGIG